MVQSFWKNVEIFFLSKNSATHYLHLHMYMNSAHILPYVPEYCCTGVSGKVRVCWVSTLQLTFPRPRAWEGGSEELCWAGRLVEASPLAWTGVGLFGRGDGREPGR